MGDPVALACPVGGPFDGTVIGDASSTRPKAVAAHGEPGGAERDPLRVPLCRGTGGRRMRTSAGMERDDGRDGFRLEKLGEAIGVEAPIVDNSAHRDGQRVGGAGLEEAL